MKVNHKLELLDQFDDAAFALMMDEYAEAEGERLRMEFEEATRAGLTPAKPDSLDEKCRKQIRREFGKQRRREYAARGKSLALRAAACILVALCISATLIMSVEAIREPFWRAITKEYGGYIDLNQNGLANSEEQSDDILQAISNDPLFLDKPADYNCISAIDDNGRLNAIYEKDDGTQIMIGVFYQTADGMLMEEDEYTRHITRDGYTMSYRCDDLVKEMVWFDSKIESTFYVSSETASDEDIYSFSSALIKHYYDARCIEAEVSPDALAGVLPSEYQQNNYYLVQGLPLYTYHDVSQTVDTYINVLVSRLNASSSIDTKGGMVETVLAGYDAIFLKDTPNDGVEDYGMVWFDTERELQFDCFTKNLSEEDHLALCEYLAEYYKNVTLPAVSTVIWD